MGGVWTCSYVGMHGYVVHVCMHVRVYIHACVHLSAFVHDSTVC